MMRAYTLVAAAAALILAAAPASAESVDASTFSCKDLTSSYTSLSEEEQYGATVILYWMAGYHATEEQGTVVDFDKMLAAFEETVDYCKKNPNIGVMSATEKFLGENLGETSSTAIDLSIMKCDAINTSTEKDAQGLGQILMWLSGYHSSYDETTVIDYEQFDTSTDKMGEFCRANSEMGFMTASKKFMGNTSTE